MAVALIVAAAALSPRPARAQSSASFPELPGSSDEGSRPPPAPAPPAPAVPASPAPPPPAYGAPAPVAPPSPTDSPVPRDVPAGSVPPGIPVASTTDSTGQAAAPALLPYRRGLPVPPGYHVIYRTANGLLVGGGTALGLGYLAALATSSGEDGGERDGALAIPLIGPWIALAAKQKNPCTFQVTVGMDASAIAATEAEVKHCVKQALSAASRLAIIAGEGAVQAFGAALIIAGAAGGRRELERDDVKRVRVAPATVTGRGGGVTVELAF